VQVIAGKNLVVRDDTGFSDPYVVLLVNQQKQKTKILSQTLFPRWNEVFQFLVTDLDQECLSVTVMDWDRMARDDFMGMFVLSLKNLVLNEEREPEWYDLQVCPLSLSLSLSLLLILLLILLSTTTHRITFTVRVLCKCVY
jgi:Ca2+-dependent lipid-binding protein